MNKPFLHIALFFISLLRFMPAADAQAELVPNGSFEEYTDCPVMNEGCDGQFNRIKGWWTSSDTPDFFHRCNNDISGTVGVPNNFWGHQEAFQGDGYVGLVPISWWDSEREANEWVSVRLVEPLKCGHSYRFSMYVSLADESPFAMNKLGAYVGHDSTYNDMNCSGEDSIPFEPQFENPGSNDLLDSSGWMHLGGTIVAGGGEHYLTIGYFHNSIQDDTTLIIDSTWWAWGVIGAYYYIDSVSLVETGAGPCPGNALVALPNVFTPNGDGLNDLWGLPADCEGCACTVYNRWGEAICTLNGSRRWWDGRTFSGQAAPGGVYYYILRQPAPDGQTETSKGFVQLLR